MKRFEIQNTPIKDLLVIQRKPFYDARGYFERIFCREQLGGVLGKRSIVQINSSFTLKKGTIRGLHFQCDPYAEMKLVTCLRGSIFDVAVDFRKDSSTYLNWYGLCLSEDNHKALVIPEGFAHGFQTLQDDCQISYLVTQFYNSDYEGALNALDPKIGIKWQLPLSEISEKDASTPMIE